MASHGIPIRLSAALATSAREMATVEDRSLTEQVEHWARIGRVVEEAVRTTTVRYLKAASHDERLPALLAAADSAEGRAAAAQLIAQRHPVRYGVDVRNPDDILRIDRAGSRTRGHVVGGTFSARRSRR